MSTSPLKNTETFIRLPDAYQIIGKAIYGAEWLDYQICVFREGKPQRTNLSCYLKADEPLRKQELRPINLRGDTRLEYTDCTETDLSRQQYIFALIAKAFGEGKLIAGRMRPNSPTIQFVTDSMWGDYPDWGENALIESNVYFKEPDGSKKEYIILIDPTGVKAYATKTKQEIGANKNPKGGRKAIIPLEAIDEIARLYNSENPPQTHRECLVAVVKFISDNREKFLTSGKSLHDITPEIGWIKEHTYALRKQGKIPS